MSTTLDLTYIPYEDCTYRNCVFASIRDVLHKDTITKEAKQLYNVVFSNLKGLMLVPRYNSSFYFVTFLNAFSKESEIYLIKYKSEMPTMYHRYKALKERLMQGRVIRRLHSNRGKEYIGHNF